VQAGLLRVLADHLERWPGLPPVSLTSGPRWSLQVSSYPRDDAAAGLVGWARSFGVIQLEVRAIPEQVIVGFAATLGDYLAQVWGCVDPLRDALGLGTRQVSSIEVGELVWLARCWGGVEGGAR
jgi:hypothetical protein